VRISRWIVVFRVGVSVSRFLKSAERFKGERIAASRRRLIGFIGRLFDFPRDDYTSARVHRPRRIHNTAGACVGPMIPNVRCAAISPGI